jgi:ferredoxin
MAYRIDPNTCAGCGSCEFECPNSAISMKGDIYVINPKKCTECAGLFDSPRCVAACPNDAVLHA